MEQDYKQVARDGEATLIVKGSRFICHIKRVATESDAQSFIQDIKKAHRKATHHCVAYSIGPQRAIQKALDDGEPSGTAGVPMLDVLKKRDIHNVVAVVTRYFGGTKLGAGGLIRAYGTAVSHALNELGVVWHTVQHVYQVTVPYSELNTVTYWLSQTPYALLRTEYTEVATIACGVLHHQAEQFIGDITERFHNKLSVVFINKQPIDLPLDKEDLSSYEEDDAISCDNAT